MRGQIVTGIKIREQDTRYVAAMFRQLVYPPEHPYSRQTDGQIETISAIARDHSLTSIDATMDRAGC